MPVLKIIVNILMLILSHVLTNKMMDNFKGVQLEMNQYFFFSSCLFMFNLATYEECD